MDREIIIKIIILLVLVILFIVRIFEITISVTIIYILLVIAILLVVVIIEIERRHKKGNGGKPNGQPDDGEPPTELDDTINELEAKCDLIERLMRGRPKAQRDALAEAKKKVQEAIDGLKKLRKGDRDPNLEGDIQRALREAADKVDEANPDRKNGPLRRLADELRDIERNLF